MLYTLNTISKMPALLESQFSVLPGDFGMHYNIIKCKHSTVRDVTYA